MIYETKGLSLEEVNDLYENVKFAPKSPGYRANIRRFSIAAEERRASTAAGKDEHMSDDSRNEKM